MWGNLIIDAMMQSGKSKSENLAHILGYQTGAVTLALLIIIVSEEDVTDQEGGFFVDIDE